MTMQMERTTACAVTVFVDATLASLARVDVDGIAVTDDFRLAEVMVLDSDLDRVRALTRRNVNAYTVVVALRGRLGVHDALDLYSAGADRVVRDDAEIVADAIAAAVRQVRRDHQM